MINIYNANKQRQTHRKYYLINKNNMKARNFLMVVSALSIAGCSQNEVTEMRQDTNPVLGFNVYTGVPTRGTDVFDYNNARYV